MEMNVKQTMSLHPITVRLKDDLSTAFIRMRREGFRHMPVIDDLGDVIGIISDRDFQRAMWPISAPDAHGLPDTPHFRNDAKVSEYMSWPVSTLTEDTSLLVAVETMIDKKISAIVVTRQEQMVGIVTHEDLLKVLAALLKEPTSLKERALHLTYNTPLGRVTEMLAVAGV